MELCAMEFEGVPYTVSYRSVRHPRLEFDANGLVVILPRGAEPAPVLERHKRWIKRTYERIQRLAGDGCESTLVCRTEDEFRRLVQRYADEAAASMGVSYNRIIFRTMRTRWASLSPKGNITVNRLMRDLPGHLIRYIVYHEVAHLLTKRHGRRFRSIMRRYFGDSLRALDEELFGLWFTVQRRAAGKQ